MARDTSDQTVPVVRQLQYRDLDELKQWNPEDLDAGDQGATEALCESLALICRWYGPLKVLSWFPNPLQHRSTLFVAEYEGQVLGIIQVSPVNQSRSTWQVDHLAVNRKAINATANRGFMDTGSRLLRNCFEKVWQARTWVIEVDINNKSALALYRFNGFQPLAQVTYWSLGPEQIQHIAQREPDLPNLLPISNADAPLLYQLETASMPPLVRQVFDQQIVDFKTTLSETLVSSTNRLVSKTETISAYVFEHQRKAAIGLFKLRVSRDGEQPHQADLTVHPAYTWLYPELIAQMARVLQPFPAQALHLASSDYQPEREEYLTQIQATPESHALLMSRSVWHKVREAKPATIEGLQLSDVLSGLQPSGKPVPGRMSWRADRWPSSWQLQQHTIQKFLDASPDKPEELTSDRSQKRGVEDDNIHN